MQDYAWVKQGMVFPFSEFLHRCVGELFLGLLQWIDSVRMLDV